MDHFAAFQFEPRPWIDGELLKQRFLQRSAEVHPDKVSSPDAKANAEKEFTKLNEAYNALRQTRTRLVHFLALQGVNAAHIQDAPSSVLEFFAPMADQTKKTDELLKQRAAATSPMLKVQLVEQALDATSNIQELQGRLTQRINDIESTVQDLDAEWASSKSAEFLRPLQEAANALGFLERWNAQLGQRLAALAF